MSKNVLSSFLLLLMVCMPCGVQAQVYNEMDADGNINQYDEYGNQNFNPNKRDSVKGEKEVPKGVWVWTVDRRFGDIRPAEHDTMPHLYQNSIYNTGLYGEYNTTGNNYSPRLSRIFIDRQQTDEFFFTQPYDYTTKQPDEFLFTNTLSPYTHISYDNCGDKQHGEDHIDAKFAVNANKRLGFGFDLDYHYGNGYYQAQNNSNFRASFFGSYRGDRYQMHLLASFYHRKHTENGGIANDKLITHPEQETVQFSEEEIPTVLTRNWNRNDSRHLFFTHRYNIGFYRKVKMTDEEIQARKFASVSAQKNKKEAKDAEEERPRGRKPSEKITEAKPMGRPKDAKIMGDEPVAEKPVEVVDTTRISVESQAMLDSLNRAQAIQDSIDATMKKEYVPVTSIIHTLDINSYDRIYQAYITPDNYYANTYYNGDYDNAYAGDSIYDQYKYSSVKNTVGLALLEGFNKYVKAGLKVFASFEYRKYQMPEVLNDGTNRYVLNSWTGHCTNIGAQLAKTQGKTLHFNLAGELGVTGLDAGSLAVDFSTDVNFALFGDTVQLAAKSFFRRTTPRFFQNQYHSKHLWWDQSLNSETRTHIEGLFSYQKTNTQLRVAIDEIQNYTYFGMSYTLDNTARKNLTAGVYQSAGNINVLTAQLRQNFQWGIINWENIVTYQNSSNTEVLPLPALNLWSNLFLKFKVARVLSVELGGCVTYFTKYYAPDYVPQLSQFAIQQNADSRVELGGYPWVDVYANMHLKRARFFIAYSHINGGSGDKNYFLTPHYPTNGRIMHVGISWNFYN